jgi:hypothetical protein
MNILDQIIANTGCHHDGPNLEPDHNGDPACQDCRNTWNDNPDQR